MFIHLKYNTGIFHRAAWEVLWYILSNPSITSVASMTSRADWTNSTFSFTTNVASDLNTAGSLIIRTDDPTNVTAHRYVGTASTNTITLRFRSYDSASQYYYVQSPGSASSTIAIRTGTATSPAFDTAPTTSANGSAMTLSNSYDSIFLSSSYTYKDVWFYINDQAILFYGSTATSTTGFAGSPSADGPFLIGQYTRYDPWNTESVGMIPVVMSTAYAATVNPYYGLSSNSLSYADLKIPNPLATTPETPFKILTAYNASPTTTIGAIPALVYNQNVHTGIGIRSAENGSLYSNLTSTASGGAIRGQAYNTSGQLQIKTADGTSNAHPVWPIYWTFGHFNMLGGNISEKSKIYFVRAMTENISVQSYAGWDFSFNGKSYMLWPLNDEPTTSFGLYIAVPME